MSATRTAASRGSSPQGARTTRSRTTRAPRPGATGDSSSGRRGATGPTPSGSKPTRPPAGVSRRIRRSAARGNPRIRAPRHRILLACTAALAVGLVAVLLLNTVISQRAFRQHELEIDLILLAEQEEALARAVQLAESPLQVEKAARKLGMVPAAGPVFLRLADGKILGEPVPAPAPTGPTSFAGAPGVRPSPKPTASPSPTATPSPVAGQAAPSTAATEAPAVLDPALDPATGLVEPQAAPATSPASPQPTAAVSAAPADAQQGVTP